MAIAKKNIPAGIAKAIEAGKIVVWTQKGAWDYKADKCKLLYRINDQKTTAGKVSDVIYNTRVPSWERPVVVYVGDKELGKLNPDDVYMDVSILEWLDDIRYDWGSKLHWFDGDIQNPVKIFSTSKWIRGTSGYADYCGYRKA